MDTNEVIDTAFPGEKESGQEQKLAQLHKEVGDPSLDTLPEGIVLGQATALVGNEVGKVGQGETGSPSKNKVRVLASGVADRRPLPCWPGGPAPTRAIISFLLMLNHISLYVHTTFSLSISLLMDI